MAYAGRNLTRSEWAQFMPKAPYRKTLPRVAWKPPVPSAVPNPMSTPHPQPPGTPYLPAWYIARPHEERLALAYLEYGKLVLLWGPRRQGRTWLWTHVADQWKAPADGRRVAPIYLHTLPPDAFTSLDACLRAFAAALLDSLDDPNVEADLEAAWAGRGDAKAKLNALLSRNVLPRTTGPSSWSSTGPTSSSAAPSTTTSPASSDPGPSASRGASPGAASASWSPSPPIPRA